MGDLLFLAWDLVEHVAKNLPRAVCLFLPDKQVGKLGCRV
jgi:hypothetical protein